MLDSTKLYLLGFYKSSQKKMHIVDEEKAKWEKNEEVHKLDKKVHEFKIYFWLWLHLAETILKYSYLSFL